MTISTITDSTMTIALNQSPSTICNGFYDIDGMWNKGFTCSMENSIQYFCCGTDTSRYCCPSDRYSYERPSDSNFNSIDDFSSIYDNILTNEINSVLINNRKLISKQFEQFQRYFLPAFILSTTILFLVGIALWFWLYKHKVFYSLGQDDLIELNTRHQTPTNSTREHTNLTVNQMMSSLSAYPTTEV